MPLILKTISGTYHINNYIEAHFFQKITRPIVIKGQTISKANYGLLKSPKKRTKCTQDTILSAFRSFFGRIEETINCFWDLLTFSKDWGFFAESELLKSRRFVFGHFNFYDFRRIRTGPIMRLTDQMKRRKKGILTRKSTVKTSMILTLMTSIPLAAVQVSFLAVIWRVCFQFSH